MLNMDCQGLFNSCVNIVIKDAFTKELLHRESPSRNIENWTPPKNSENLSTFIVAEVIRIFKSRLLVLTFLKIPKRTSVLSDRS
jgi:hypothetical protein